MKVLVISHTNIICCPLVLTKELVDKYVVKTLVNRISLVRAFLAHLQQCSAFQLNRLVKINQS